MSKNDEKLYYKCDSCGFVLTMKGCTLVELVCPFCKFGNVESVKKEEIKKGSFGLKRNE